jgi:hypothetical protein
MVGELTDGHSPSNNNSIVPARSRLRYYSRQIVFLMAGC